MLEQPSRVNRDAPTLGVVQSYPELKFRLRITIVTSVPDVNTFVGEVIGGRRHERDGSSTKGMRMSLQGSTGARGPDVDAERDLGAHETRRPMRADAAKNHERILEAAEETFALEGLNVPIDTVAERAGVGVGTLYRHFPTKEALFEAIVVARLDKLIDAASELLRDRDPSEALFEFLRVFAKQASLKQDLFEAISEAGIDVKERFASLIDELVSRLEAMRSRAVDAGAIRGDVATSDIMSLVVGTCHAAGKTGIDDTGLERLVDIVIAGIRT
jgi:AcrR family transcriptional regulator